MRLHIVGVKKPTLVKQSRKACNKEAELVQWEEATCQNGEAALMLYL